MKSWNDRRLKDFYRLNFDPETTKYTLLENKLTVTDEEGDSITFVIQQNRIYSPDTQKYYH